jgi:integrase
MHEDDTATDLFSWIEAPRNDVFENKRPEPTGFVCAYTRIEILQVVTYNHKVGELIDTFLKWREKQGMCCVPESKLFLDKKGLDMHIDTVRGAFERIREHAGISRSDKSPFQPRLHDLRHTFAVHRLTSWYRENQDVQQLLPVLSTYLGHTHLSHTYLTMTDGLLGEANNRFESYIKQGKDE